MKLYKVIFILFIVVACGKEQQPVVVPECLLSEQEMIDMMVDFSLVKSAKSVGRKDLKYSGIKPLEYLYAKHAVDTAVIKDNLMYYNSDLKKSKQLYDTVISILKKREEILKVVMDSLSKDEEKNQKDDLEDDDEDLSNDD